MKKLYAIFILLAFIFNSFGFVLLQPFLINYYKYLGMKRAGFPSEDELIEFLVFKKSEIETRQINFKWIHSKEFRYNDNIYDIVSRSEDDSMFYFHVINDTKEKEFEEKFNKKVEDNSSDSKQANKESNQIKILFSELLNQQNCATDLSGQKYNTFNSQNYYSALQDVPTPPPRFS
ncbi:MAG TPA: hypothetical protein VH917_02375 [Ignavibacteriaceae bacterium]